MAEVIGIGKLVTGGLGVLSHFNAAQANAYAGEIQARSDLLQSRAAANNAKLEVIAGKEKQIEINRNLERVQANQIAINAARNILEGSGSAEAARATAASRASEDIDNVRFNSQIRADNQTGLSNRLAGDSALAKIRGSSKQTSSLIKAGTAAYDLLSDYGG